jgi:hypothetical protein
MGFKLGDKIPRLRIIRRDRGRCRNCGHIRCARILRAEGGTLKVGVLLPRSGLPAGLGLDCQRGIGPRPGLAE